MAVPIISNQGGAAPTPTAPSVTGDINSMGGNNTPFSAKPALPNSSTDTIITAPTNQVPSPFTNTAPTTVADLPQTKTPVSSVVSPTIKATDIQSTPAATPNTPAPTTGRATLPVTTTAVMSTPSPYDQGALPPNTVRVDPTTGEPLDTKGNPQGTTYNADGTVASQGGSNNSSFWDKLMGYITSDNSKGQVTSNLQTQFGLDSAQKAYTDAVNNYNSTQNAYNQKLYEMQTTNPFGKTAGALAGDVQNLQFTRDQHLANLAIIKSAAANDVNSINSIIDAKIKAQFEPIETTIKNLEDYASANPNISQKDKVDLQNQADTLKEKQTAYSTVLSNVATNAPIAERAQLLQAVDKAMADPNSTAGDIYKAGGAYAGAAKYTSTVDAFGNPIAFDSSTGTYKYPDGTPATPGSDTGNAGNAVVQSTMNLIGASQDMPVSQAIQKFGMDAIVNGLVQQEGGTPQGTNNPGNIKYATWMTGATKGKAASDGGNFANFNSPQDFQNTIRQLVNKAGDQNLSDFIAQYKGVSSSAPSYQNYGLLANTQSAPGGAFNPQNQIDQLAYQYIQKYLTSGAVPSASSLGRNVKPGMFGQISARANELVQAATGSALPNPVVLKSNIDLITKNNNLLNNLSIQEGTIQKNFGLNLQNLSDNNVNSSIPIINNLLNSIADATGSPSVAQYLSQNQTIQNELASLLSVKNASGTTVADKISSETILPKGATAQQAKAIIDTLIKEAENQANTIKQRNGSLYAQVDPLQMDPNNPNRSSGGGNVTMTAPDGSKWNVPSDKVALFKQNGYQ